MDRTTTIAVYAADRDWLQAKQRELSFAREKTVTMPELIQMLIVSIRSAEAGA
jgi:hypothetical protein